MHRIRTALAACALGLLAASAAQATIIGGTIHKTFNVAEGGTLYLDSDLGDISINPAAGGDLDLGHIAGVVEAHTSGGDVHIAGARSMVTLSTSGGDVSVGDAAAAV